MSTDDSGTAVAARLAAAGVALACPRCGGAVEPDDAAFACAVCPAAYPLIAGIPDFRIGPDRFLAVEPDRNKALAVLEASAPGDVDAALDAYWERTPETPAAEAARYRDRQRAETAIGDAVLGELERLAGPLDPEDGPLLDLGAGAGGITAAAARRGLSVVALDSALRWLAVARRRLEAKKTEAVLLAAHAEHPPLAPAAFGTIVVSDALEWFADPAGALAAARRLAAPGARLYLASNRRGSPLAPSAASAWTPAEARAALQAAGWRVIAAGRAPVHAHHLSGPAAWAAAAAGLLGARFQLVAEPDGLPALT